MALEKGTEEWMFWSDLFQACKKYWEIQDNEKYWQDLSQEMIDLYNKYKTPFAGKFCAAFLDAQNEKYQLKKREEK